MSKKLTPRQAQVLACIKATLARDGLPPTRAELAEALGFRSPNAAEDHLRALARKGFIELRPGTSRGIRLCTSEVGPSGAAEPPDTKKILPAAHEMRSSASAQPLPGMLMLPVVGAVAAGLPILAAPHVEARYQVASDLFRGGVDYLLRVRGMSMRDAGILDGDLLAVRATQEVVNGQIVVARLEDEVTVKRFRRQGNRVTLLPENPDFAPLYVDLDTQPLHIEGLAVGVVRPSL